MLNVLDSQTIRRDIDVAIRAITERGIGNVDYLCCGNMGRLFSKDGLETIAEVAIERETGVRALRSILEGILLDILYELPNRKGSLKFVVDREVVFGQRKLALGIGHEQVAEPEPAPEESRVERGPVPPEKRESA